MKGMCNCESLKFAYLILFGEAQPYALGLCDTMKRLKKGRSFIWEKPQ